MKKIFRMSLHEVERVADVSRDAEIRITNDLEGLKPRIAEYREMASHADMVILTTVCSDSRVVLPEGLVEIHSPEGKLQKALFISLPTIGGGAPSRSRLRQSLAEIRSWGVDGDKLRILVTQHGDTDEIDHSHHSIKSERITCGLRGFFGKYQKQLTEIRHQLVAWSDEYKQRIGDITAAPDRLPLSVFEKECPDILELITALSNETGPEGFRIPRRLILRAAYRNESFDIEENGESVRAKIADYLRHHEYEDIYKTCKVGLAHYDHQLKKLTMFNQYAKLDIAEKIIELPGLVRRTDTIQNPHHVIISFGKEIIPLHKGIILPHLARSADVPDGQNSDNVFQACASIPRPETLLDAIAEASYAILHKVHPHTGDLNFSDLQDCNIICENDDYANVIEQMIQTEEWKEEYLSMFQKLNKGKLYVVNLHLDQPDQQSEAYYIQL